MQAAELGVPTISGFGPDETVMPDRRRRPQSPEEVALREEIAKVYLEEFDANLPMDGNPVAWLTAYRICCCRIEIAYPGEYLVFPGHNNTIAQLERHAKLLWHD